MNAEEYKQGIRAGAYAWPGGYPRYLVMADGESLCFSCARQNAREILTEIHYPGSGDTGWRPIDFDINWEDPELFCAQCSTRIESAYAEEEASHDV